MSRIKNLVGIARPGGLDDLLVRAIKIGIIVFLSQPFVELARQGSFDLNLAVGAIRAAAAAGVGVIVNATLLALTKFANA